MTDKEITDYIFINDEDSKADLALVFGTWKAWKESTIRAVKLYKDKLVPKLLFSGGVLNNVNGMTEADAMAQEAIRLGVDKSDILIENKSTNSLENVTFSLEVIKNSIGIDKVKTLTAVVKNYHARRALMTIRKHFPKNIKLKATVYKSEAYRFSRNDWMNSKSSRDKVMEEVEKIKEYLKKGDIEEL